MPYETTRDLVEDVLFRCFEPGSSADWGPKTLDYINRTYQTLCAGSSEFLPEYVDDWWWLRESGVLTLEPAIIAGTVDVTDGSTNVTFSVAPAASVAGYRLRVDNHPEVFQIASHTGGVGAAVLDSPYTGETNTAATYRLMKVTYTLSANVQAIISPFIGFRNNHEIIGVSPERMDALWPLVQLNPGVPVAFALEDEQTVRFSHGGLDTGRAMRVEYRYRPVIEDLENTALSIPLVPKQFRQVLSDMAATLVLLDKNDDRSNAVALMARTLLAAMFKENRRRLKKIGAETVGHIYPRQSGRHPQRNTGPLRTESGLIIG